MNHLRRGAGAVVLAAVVLAACADDGQSVRSGEPDAPSTIRRATANAGPWVDLPPSPVGDWPEYHWAWLSDGSGFVHAGAHGPRGEQTSAAAVFRFDDGDYTELPDLPFEGGMGLADAAWVGDTLVLVGQTCGPSPGASFSGAALCDDGRDLRRLTATLTDGADEWEVADLPDEIGPFRYGRPSLLGVSDGKVVIATGDLLPVLEAFDPATGEWEHLPPVPTVNPGTDGSGMSFGGPAPIACVADGTILTFVLGGLDPGYNLWWRWDGSRFAEMNTPVPGNVTYAMCSTAGVYVVRQALPPDPKADLTFARLDGTTTEILPYSEDGVGALGQIFGDVLEVSPWLGEQSAWRFATPEGLVTSKLTDRRNATVHGRYAVRENSIDPTLEPRSGPGQYVRVIP